MNLDLELLRKDIELRTGVKDITSESRDIEDFVSRSIFIKIADKDKSVSNLDISIFLKKNHSTIIHSRKSFDKYMSRHKRFREIYEALDPSNSLSNKSDNQITIRKLRLQVMELKNKLKTHSGTRLKHSHYPLLEILNNIPDYHVQTVKMRLEPIVKMLEKPSMHNYLPSIQ